MKSLLMLFIVFVSLNIHAAEKCSSFTINSKKLRLIKDKKTVKVVYDGFESQFDCSKSGLEYKCYGTDDSAKFDIYFDQSKLKLYHITFGEPDSKTLQLSEDGKVFFGKSCITK